jgi:hypothetical protein
MNNIAHVAMGRDLEHLAREGSPAPFTSDPRIDPKKKADANFFFREGMTREQMLDRERELRRDDLQADAVSDLVGEPPSDVGDQQEIVNGVSKTKRTLNLKGLPPQQKRHALYRAQLASLASVLEGLEAKKVELEALIAAPAESEGALRKAVRQTADALLGRAGSGAESEAAALTGKLAIANHRADAARLALPMLEQDIDRARIRLKFWDGREMEFLGPVLVEAADHLGALYLQQIERLRITAGVLFSLSGLVKTYGDGFQATEPIKFPQMGLPSLAGAKAEAFVIGARGDGSVWRGVIEALRRNPAAKVDTLIPTPIEK